MSEESVELLTQPQKFTHPIYFVASEILSQITINTRRTTRSTSPSAPPHALPRRLWTRRGLAAPRGLLQRLGHRQDRRDAAAVVLGPLRRPLRQLRSRGTGKFLATIAYPGFVLFRLSVSLLCLSLVLLSLFFFLPFWQGALADARVAVGCGREGRRHA